MTLNELLNQMKQHPDFHQAGMVLCHNGVVRGTSRDGRKVNGLSVSVDKEKLAAIIEKNKKREGVLDILVHINEGAMKVGDDVMYLIVAGDIRDNVIPALESTLNEIKSTVTSKTEFFVE